MRDAFTRPWPRLALLLIVVAIAPPVAGAQSRNDAPAWSIRLAPTARLTITALADSLDVEQLPSSALLDKAAEGVLKGATDDRIVNAVQALAQRLRTSRVLLGPDALPGTLLASSSALYAGVPETVVAQLVASNNKRPTPRSLTEPFTVLAELSSARVPTAVAVKSINTLIDRGAADADLRAFRVQVTQQLQQGVSPRDATEQSAQRILRGIDRIP